MTCTAIHITDETVERAAVELAERDVSVVLNWQNSPAKAAMAKVAFAEKADELLLVDDGRVAA